MAIQFQSTMNITAADSGPTTETERQPLGGSPLSDPQERAVIFAALDSFRQFRKNSHYSVTHRRRQNLYALPRHHREILTSTPYNLLDTLIAVDDAIDCNGDVADAILQVGLQAFDLPEMPDNTSNLNWHGTAKPGDISKAHSTIRQFYRDWSAEGFQVEVKPLLNIIAADLKVASLLPTASAASTVLLPGAGLGRLLFELSLMGYAVEGNEISYHQLLASNFVLNNTIRPEQFRLYPFASTFTNQTARSGQLKEVLIPDVHPGLIIADRLRRARQGEVAMGEMNMTAGDFLTSYSGPANQGSFNAVVTVYFIDTAPNLIRYIETIKHTLQAGGVWINIGPLLWHFDGRANSIAQDEVASRVSGSDQCSTLEDAGIGEPGSFELTDEEVLLLVRQMGFEIITQEYLPEEFGGYIQDKQSMIQNRYKCSHWMARKL